MSERTTFNLMREPWIPIQRHSGQTEWIAPWQITDGIDSDPIVKIAAPRPDFSAALTEFLIGLLATAAAPEDIAAWRMLGRNPPRPEKLRQRFAQVEQAFDLDGPGPRFMQDLDPDLGGAERPIAALLIDSPGENTVKLNRDLFVKRGGLPTLCRAAAAMALFTLQTYAPQGGQGHRTSLRGGGPLTTLVVLGDRLWDHIWPNVETRDSIAARSVGGAHAAPEDTFPWLAGTRVSGKNGRRTNAANAHPLQVYWGMPRRVRLELSQAEGARCALTGRADPILARGFRTRNFGVDYGEGWDHPLSPYSRKKTGAELLPVHGRPGGVSYRHWLGLVVKDQDSRRVPAAVVRRSVEQPRLAAGGALRLAVFGYDMDNMKARSWIESEVPLHDLQDQEVRKAVRGLAEGLVLAAEDAARALTGSVKRALFDDPKAAPGDFGFIAERFWRDTEPAFYRALHEGGISAKSDPAALQQRTDWPRALARAALAIFDELAPSESLETGATRRVVGARFGLVMTLRGEGKGGEVLYHHLELLAPKARRQRDKKQEAMA